jgi:uncharacterized protein (DUF58 family)
LHSFSPKEFYYRLRWRARGAQPGSHPTRMPGGSLDFRGHVPFLESPDPRRIDIRASLRSVPKKLMSRAFYERGAVDVVVILDLSASMSFSGAGHKIQMAADITASIAWSATRHGDNFSLIACDDVVRLDMLSPPSHRLGVAQDIYAKLMSASFNDGTGSSALAQAAGHLRRKRSLVFLLSDFHLNESLMKKTLNSLSTHDVVPVVLWDSAEYQDIPQWGWARVRDMEGSGDASLFMRPKLAEKIRNSYRQRRQEIIRLCKHAGTRTPFFTEDRFNAEQLTRHMLEAC